ncbi:MAG: hypothetical protein S0880_26395 [Actinomycetota bacterium]|nr:hypothetical protein [Actinomycetota bacterium]
MSVQPSGAAGDVVEFAREVLEPVVVERGFSGGQGGLGGDGSVNLIYCASATELVRRWPRAFELIPGADPGPQRCVDLMIEVTADGLLRRADLEGATDLGALVDAAGGDGRRLALDELRSVDHRTALTRIAAAIEVLFPLEGND